MQVEGVKIQRQEFMEPESINTILCPMCGIQFSPRLGNVCEACLLAKTDITVGITKEGVVTFCRFCNRFLKPPWVSCERDSKQLLALLLKKIRGLGKAKIINAGFVWTEQHSKRLKVKLTIEKELSNQTKVEQTFITEFTEMHTQCDDCKKQFTPHTWGAVVQVRQHVDHKKTFFYIEQLILKHGAYDKVLKVSSVDDGINFYYKNSTHAQRLIDFLGSILPLTVKHSKQLISHDESSNVFSYKYTFSVEIPKLCRNDLLLLPAKLARELGGCCRLVLCWKVAQDFGLLDLNNFNYIQMSNIQYHHYEKDMEMLPLARYRREFQILNSEPCDKNKFRAQKSRLNKLASKLYIYNVMRRGQWENLEITGSLGEIHCGQLVEGFDLRELSHTQELTEIKGIQDIILVRRFRDKAHKRRAFKLRKLEEEGIMVEEDTQTRKKKEKKKTKQAEQDYEEFLDDVEADKGLRKEMNLYKNSEVLRKDMTKEELDEILGQMDLCELFDNLSLSLKPEETGKQLSSQEQQESELQGINELIEKMEKVHIDKP